MVTSPASLNPPTDRRSISIDDYQPPSPSPQSSSSESDNDENDTPTPRPTRPPRRRAPRKSNSSISLDSLDRDELADEAFSEQRPQPPNEPSPKPPTERPVPAKQTVCNGKQVVKAKLSAPNSDTPGTDSMEMEPDEPISDDNLVNIESLPSTDDFGWDRFIFFSHRAQRFEFPEDTYLSNFSPFSAVASAMIGLNTRSVCAVCGSGGNMISCVRCPLAFHHLCVDPFKPAPSGSSWMCPACRSAKNGDTSPNWLPAPNLAPPPLPDPSTGLKRLIMDAREGNPMDMVFAPSLFNYYRKIAGADWLRCARCRRIRIVQEGVLSEAVRIPFECQFAFWADSNERRCQSFGDQKVVGKSEQRVIQYIRSRKTQRQLLFRFLFDQVDAVDYGKPDLANEPVLRPLKPSHPPTKPPSVTPMEISPAPTPVQRAQPVISGVSQYPQQRVVDMPARTTPPRQIIPSAAQLVQPQVASTSTTPQPSPQSTPQSVAAPTPQMAGLSMQTSPTGSAATSDVANAAPPKSEPVENGQKNNQDLLTFIATLDWDEWVEDELTDLALANNKQLNQLYVALRAAPAKFQRQAARLAQRMKGQTQPQQPSPVQPQSQLQPQPQRNLEQQQQSQVQPQPQRQQMPMQASMQAQQRSQQMPMQLQQASAQIQKSTPQRPHQATIDSMFRQMAIKHVKEMQELEQQFMRRMEEVPAAQVAELMGMKDITIAKLKHRQQQDIRQFWQTHGVR